MTRQTSKGQAIPLLARNTPPPIACSVCGKPATEVCSQCIYEGMGWLCDTCAESHGVWRRDAPTSGQFAELRHVLAC